MLTIEQQIGRKDVVKPRFTSLQQQLKSVIELGDDVQSVLEVGPGRGYFLSMAKILGYEIKSLDKYSNLETDFNCDVAELEQDSAFDAVVAFEVLEHMAYEDSKRFFGELARLSKNWVVISLPTRQLRWRRILKGRSPVIPDLPSVTIEEHWKPHHWELGRKSYPIKKIIQDFSDQGAQFVRQFQNTDHRYHTFLIFKTQLTKG